MGGEEQARTSAASPRAHALAHLAPGGLLPVAGGVIVKGADGYPIGAVGVTGCTSDNDEIAALAGITAAGLTPQ